jgi:hypothetical protein
LAFAVAHLCATTRHSRKRAGIIDLVGAIFSFRSADDKAAKVPSDALAVFILGHFYCPAGRSSKPIHINRLSQFRQALRPIRINELLAVQPSSVEAVLN